MVKLTARPLLIISWILRLNIRSSGLKIRKYFNSGLFCLEASKRFFRLKICQTQQEKTKSCGNISLPTHLSLSWMEEEEEQTEDWEEETLESL